MKLINEMVEEFLSDCNVVSATRNVYKYSLRSWVKWLTVTPSADVRAPERKDVIRWKDDLLSMGHTDMTVQSYLKVLSRFYSWQEEHHYNSNIAKGMCKRKKYIGYRKKYLTVKEVTKLRNSMPRETLAHIRNIAIVNLMIATGLRCVEVSRLCINDLVPFDGGCYIKIQRKGHTSKDQTYCMGLDAFKFINEYLNERMAENVSEPLFINHGFHSSSESMNPAIIGQIVAVELDRIGLTGKEYTAHSLRHTFAVLSLLEGASLYDLQIALGHSDVEMTQIYLKSVEEERRKLNGAVFALDKMLSRIEKNAQ